MGFIDFLTESIENSEVEDEFDPKEIELGLQEEKEHKDLYDIVKKCADENEIEMPVSEDDFFLTIVKAHLRENPNYYSILIDAMKPKEESTEEESIN